MTEEINLDSYVDALRDDLPSTHDVDRIRRRLVGAGLGVSLALATRAVAAASPLAKASLVSSLAARFVNLSLISQIGLATTATSLAISGPVWVATRWHQGSSSSGVGNVATPKAQGPKNVTGPLSMPVPVPAVPALAVASAAAIPSSTANLGPAKLAGRPQSPSVSSGAAVVEFSALGEETRLIDQALSAIRAGDLPLATQLLDEHAARFPVARLAHEEQRARLKLEEARRRSSP